MENNITYLLNSYSTDDLLRQFYERTGKIRNFKPTGEQVFWEEDLAGSNAGRFLMGAANTVRWIKDPELQRRSSMASTNVSRLTATSWRIPKTPFSTPSGQRTPAHGLLMDCWKRPTAATPRRSQCCAATTTGSTSSRSFATCFAV
jgi:hypothetical protein